MFVVAATPPLLARAHTLALLLGLALTGCGKACDHGQKAASMGADVVNAPLEETGVMKQAAATEAPPSLDSETAETVRESAGEVNPEEAATLAPRTRSGKVLRLPKGGTLKPVRSLPPLTHPSASSTP
ncbi:MAG: hypothetical protein ACO3JL_09635 [Myxococcota bacterium]